MVDYTNPVETTFELQRKSIEGGQDLIEQTIDLPNRLSEAAVDSLENQESVQRSIVELQQETLYGFLDAVEENLPGEESPTADLRDLVDDQYDTFFENHEELFDDLEEALDDGFETYGEFSEESVEALDDLVEALVEANEEFEAQSVEATEQVGEQVEEVTDQVEEVTGQVGEQVEDVQEQIQDVSEEAADAVEV